MAETTAPDLPVRHIYRWDLDKTYLATEFDSIRDLLRTAFQKAEEKVNVPGADALLRELTRADDESRVLLTFISGSPRQMREVLTRKFEIDGIQPDSFILKPTLENILKGRFRAIKGHVGFKLEALLRVRSESPVVPETLFGDDSEQDAFIYSLYRDILSEKLSIDEIRDILVEAEVYARPIERIMELVTEVDHEDSVDRVFIHLDRKSPPGRFRVFGPSVVPIANYFQAALVLYADGVLDVAGLTRVANGMIETHDYGLTELANSFQDLLRRRHLRLDALDRLAEEISSAKDEIKLSEDFLDQFVGRVRALSPARAGEDEAARWAGPPDYIEVLRADRSLKKAVTQKRTSLFS